MYPMASAYRLSADNLIESVKYKVEEFTGMEVEKINVLWKV